MKENSFKIMNLNIWQGWGQDGARLKAQWWRSIHEGSLWWNSKLYLNYYFFPILPSPILSYLFHKRCHLLSQISICLRSHSLQWIHFVKLFLKNKNRKSGLSMMFKCFNTEDSMQDSTCINSILLSCQLACCCLSMVMTPIGQVHCHESIHGGLQ